MSKKISEEQKNEILKIKEKARKMAKKEFFNDLKNLNKIFAIKK